MSKSDTFENDLLQLILNNVNAALIGDATGLRGSSVAGSLYAALHSADPGEAGNQSTSEVTYTGYARQAIARSSAGFTISGSSASLTSAVNFPASSGGGSPATYFSIGVASSGAGKILYSGVLNNAIPCNSAGVAPQLGAGTTITED